MITFSSSKSHAPLAKFGEAPPQRAVSSELINAWDKTSHDLFDLIKPKLPDIQKEGKAFKEAAQKGDQKTAQKHFEASIDRVNALLSNTLQAMKLKFPEIMALQQASPEQKKQLAQHINLSTSSKFQEFAMQTAKARVPQLKPEEVAFIDKAIIKTVDAVKSEIPAFIKAKIDLQKAQQKFMLATEKAMNEVESKISKDLPESLKRQGTSLEHNKRIAEYSRQLTRQKLQQATQELMKNTQSK